MGGARRSGGRAEANVPNLRDLQFGKREKRYLSEMLPAGGSKAIIGPRRPPNIPSLKYTAAVQ